MRLSKRLVKHIFHAFPYPLNNCWADFVGRALQGFTVMQLQNNFPKSTRSLKTHRYPKVFFLSVLGTTVLNVMAKASDFTQI